MITKDTKFAIIGLGLLGGSYAEGLSKAAYQVTGIDSDPEAVAYALQRQWISKGGDDPSLISDCDIVIFALYPDAFIQWVRENQRYFKSGALLSDVTGVKRKIIEDIDAILRKDVEFIACHPMAGRGYKGISYADASQFVKANYIIVPTASISNQAIEEAEDIAAILKFCHISFLDPKTHDQLIALVSQLCHVIAVSLMNISDDPKLAEYTGTSFLDLTRVAVLNEELWPELFISNKDYLLDDIDALIEQLNTLKEYIAAEDSQAMKEMMLKAAERRKALE